MKFTKIIFLLFMTFSISLASEENLELGVRKFTTKLFKELLKSKPNENIIFSPITIQILMSLLITGTNRVSPAVKEIRDVMEFPLTKGARKRAFEKLINDFKFVDTDFRFFDANKMYFSPECQLTNWFRNEARNIYKADAEIISFNDTKNAADKINNWVAGRTDNNIKNFIPSAELSDQTKMLMINALYLMGKWEVPFHPGATEDDVFGGPTSKLVKMMKSQKKTYEYFENNNFQYLKLGLYRKQGDAAVIFVLPQCSVSCVATENNVADAFSDHTFEKAELTTAALPKFKFENNLQLKAAMINLGVKKIFESSLLEGFNVDGNIFHTVADIFQKALIDVNELGVTAVAGTEVPLGVDSTQHPVYKTFIADHPFIFYITVSDVIVFAGYVVDP